MLETRIGLGLRSRFCADLVGRQGPSSLLVERLFCSLVCAMQCYIAVAALKNIFNFVLGPHLPRVVPGEGPDCHLLQEIAPFWADSGPNPGGDLIYVFWCWP